MTQRINHNQASYDLVVIGGGINGAAIARDAALRGLSVCLLEKEDFCVGASSKTSKLAHGGLRYLEQFNFSLVRESLKERDILFKNAPHLVQPLPFLVPVYIDSPHYLTTLRIGLFLYDFMSGSAGLPKHRKLNRDEVIKAFPEIKKDGLKGGCLYYDGQMNDIRLVMENILSAETAGAVVYNYARVDSLIYLDEKIAGVAFTDLESGEKGKIYGRRIVNATGAWTSQIDEGREGTDKVVLAPTKGVHIVVPEVNAGTSLLLNAPQDGRVFFVTPWEGKTLIGTTDTYYNENPDHLSVLEEDKNYLLTAYNAYFPEAKLMSASIITSFAGLRPLVLQKGSAPSEVDREHEISMGKDNLITIAGGKYTTHRAVAEEVVDRVIASLPDAKKYEKCVTKESALPGAESSVSEDQIRKLLLERGLSDEVILHLIANYGKRSLVVADYLLLDPSGINRISPSQPYLLGEIDYCIHMEHARHLADWYFRRSTLGHSSRPDPELLSNAANRFAKVLKWDKRQVDNEIASILNK